MSIKVNAYKSEIKHNIKKNPMTLARYCDNVYVKIEMNSK